MTIGEKYGILLKELKSENRILKEMLKDAKTERAKTYIKGQLRETEFLLEKIGEK